jgi:exodeoxyribonuclease VII small subunit
MSVRVETISKFESKLRRSSKKLDPARQKQSSGHLGGISFRAPARAGFKHWTQTPNSSTFASMPKAAQPAAPEMLFEEALQKLESIVESMEGQELSLETLLARYEEGTQLAKVCQAKLAEAEIKIQQLEKSTGGEPILKPFSLAENSSQE